MKLTVLQGKDALSAFRVDTLISGLRSKAPVLDVCRLEAGFVYFVESNADLADDVLQKTETLLSSSGIFNNSDGFYVIPRTDRNLLLHESLTLTSINH